VTDPYWRKALDSNASGNDPRANAALPIARRYL
jgi:hypothetical protein